MGRFVNPDNSAFQTAVNSEIYVDKTGLLSYTKKCLTQNRHLYVTDGQGALGNQLQQICCQLIIAGVVIPKECLMDCRSVKNRYIWST